MMNIEPLIDVHYVGSTISCSADGYPTPRLQWKDERGKILFYFIQPSSRPVNHYVYYLSNISYMVRVNILEIINVQDTHIY